MPLNLKHFAVSIILGAGAWKLLDANPSILLNKDGTRLHENLTPESVGAIVGLGSLVALYTGFAEDFFQSQNAGYFTNFYAAETSI